MMLIEMLSITLKLITYLKLLEIQFVQNVGNPTVLAPAKIVRFRLESIFTEISVWTSIISLKYFKSNSNFVPQQYKYDKFTSCKAQAKTNFSAIKLFETKKENKFQQTMRGLR